MMFRTIILFAGVVIAAGSAGAAERSTAAPSASQVGNNAAITVDGATEADRSAGMRADDSRATSKRTRSDDNYYATDPADENEVGPNRTGAVDNDLDTDRAGANDRDPDMNRSGATDNDHTTKRTHGDGDTTR